jgi:hypothetical protein
MLDVFPLDMTDDGDFARFYALLSIGVLVFGVGLRRLLLDVVRVTPVAAKAGGGGPYRLADASQSSDLHDDAMAWLSGGVGALATRLAQRGIAADSVAAFPMAQGMVPRMEEHLVNAALLTSARGRWIARSSFLGLMAAVSMIGCLRVYRVISAPGPSTSLAALALAVGAIAIAYLLNAVLSDRLTSRGKAAIRAAIRARTSDGPRR